jgi:cysteinyl-tRNA synthetase
MLKIYNSLTRKKEVFKPRKDKKVNLFVCGPTVYDFSHLGHARTYIFYDTFVSYLKWLGFKVFYLQNITNIDDKIIQKAREKKQKWNEISKRFEKEYLKDMKALSINSVYRYARATDYIKEIQSQVRRLLKKGFAYDIENDGIYFNIKKFKDYGKLSRRTLLQAEDATSRIDKSVKKINKGDFCLWKYKSPNIKTKYEPSWKSPWGLGRPGWHIEDTAISEKHFGTQYDIHGGAKELMFPHHEAEIAQMEAISGKKPLVKYWVHTGLLTINNKKMSKSLGNFITIKDFLKKHSPEVLRFLVFSTHYRSPLDYSEKTAKETMVNLKKLEGFLKRLNEIKEKKINLYTPTKNSDRLVNTDEISEKSNIEKLEKEFWKALNNDFNTPKAKGLIFEFVSDINKKISKKQISGNEVKKIYNFFKEINKIFKFLDFKKIEQKEKIPPKVSKLLLTRKRLREEKKWKEADEIRKEIKKLGYQIEDTEKETIVKKLNSNKELKL